MIPTGRSLLKRGALCDGGWPTTTTDHREPVAPLAPWRAMAVHTAIGGRPPSGLPVRCTAQHPATATPHGNISQQRSEGAGIASRHSIMRVHLCRISCTLPRRNEAKHLDVRPATAYVFS